MTELRAKAIKKLEEFPEEHVAEVIDFMEKVEERESKKAKEAKAAQEKEAQEEDPLAEILAIVNRRERHFPADFDWKKEYLEWVDEKYGTAN